MANSTGNPMANSASNPPELPQSTALAEASPTSLAEFFDRNPEEPGYVELVLPRLIAELRAQRERHLTAEAMGLKPKARKTPATPPVDPEDLGI